MNQTMTLSQRADALEAKMARELDYIVIKSRLYSMAEGDMSPPPNAGMLMKDNPKARVLMGDDPRLPAMPEKPTLTDFFKYRFGPSMHLLQAPGAPGEGGPAREDGAGLPAARHFATIGLIRGDHGYWGAQLVGPMSTEVTWAIRAHQVLRFYPDRSAAKIAQSTCPVRPDYHPDPCVGGGLWRMRAPQMVHVGPADHPARHLLVPPQPARRARRVHRHHRPQLPPARTGPRLRQQPGRAHVAGDDPPGEVPVAGITPRRTAP